MFEFIQSRFANPPLPSPSSFNGKTIIVTGGNTGLGLEAARHIVRLGAAKVILGCRNHEKGEVAKKDIEESTQRESVLEVWQVDLCSYDSVKEFCARAQGLERLDAVIENAGILMARFEECEGMETTVTVNVISTFLMALLLLPKLRESATRFNITPRLTIVSSDAHEQALVKELSEASIFTALKSPNYLANQYPVSKLLEILTVRELAAAMTASTKAVVILNTLTPGFCRSELFRNLGFLLGLLAWVLRILLARPTEVGSRTLVAAAAAGEETHGAYMVDCKIREPSRWVRSEKGKEAQKRVYEELLAILEGIQPGITGNI